MNLFTYFFDNMCVHVDRFGSNFLPKALGRSSIKQSLLQWNQGLCDSKMVFVFWIFHFHFFPLPWLFRLESLAFKYYDFFKISSVQAPNVQFVIFTFQYLVSFKKILKNRRSFLQIFYIGSLSQTKSTHSTTLLHNLICKFLDIVMQFVICHLILHQLV